MEKEDTCMDLIAMACTRRLAKDWQAAIEIYRKALAVDCSSIEAWIGLALSLEEVGDRDAAHEALLSCLKHRPQTAYAHHRLGYQAYQQRHYMEALTHYQQAVLYAPNWYEPFHHAAVCCQELRHYPEAFNFYQRAIERKNDLPVLWYHYAKALKDAGLLDDALTAYQHALKLKPDYADAQYSLGLLHLLRGDWITGWNGYELRWQGSDRAAIEHRPETVLPLWQGEGVPPGSGIVVYAEQGMGDSIQCFRYMNLLKACFDKVKFACQAPLVNLFQANAPNGVSVVPRIKQPINEADYDYYIHTLSLPGIFKTTPQHLPAEPYLAPQEGKVKFWQTRLIGERRLKVGLVWKGGELSYAPARDMDFTHLSPLLDLQAICWISLQKDDVRPSDARITDWMGEVSDFADTAALIANLDLVIAVDTAVAHLAGAQGKPVWLLNRFESEWRWMRGSEVTPWYPTMRLFNQPAPGDWGGVIQNVLLEISKLYCGKTSTLTIDQAPQQAITHHRKGQLQEAEHLYRAILQAMPNHSDANHNLGVLAIQVKQPAAGLPHLKTALEANQSQGQYWLSYIDALIQTGQTDAAQQVLERGRLRGLQGEVVEALMMRLESGAQSAEQSSAEYPHAAKESSPVSSEILQNSKIKPTKPNKLARKSVAHKEKNPSPKELKKLVVLFTEGRYTEAAILAQTMTERFPLHGFGWKLLGATFTKQGLGMDALAPMQKAAALSPSDAEVHCNLGSVLKDMGKLDEAETSCRRALQIKPDFVEALSNLGNILRDMGRLDEAQASYRRALEIKPDFAKGHNNLGNLLKDMGWLDEAEDSYRRALQIKPDFAEAHSNLGVTLQEQNRLDEAEASYRQALAIKPDFAEAHSNLGVTLQKQSRLDEAEASYRRALEIKPDYIGALNNFALLFNVQGKSMMALNLIKQSLQIKETGEAKGIFVTCLKRLRFTHDDSSIRLAMVRALTEPWGRPSELAQIGSDLVKLNPAVGGGVARAADAWPLRLSAQDLFGSDGLTMVATDPLLCAILNSAPILDIEMERFLTMARCAMLEAAIVMAPSGGDVGTVLSFYSALARQCFINEYVFSHTDGEIQKASDLRDSLVAALEAKIQVPILWLVAVAAYFPLCSLPRATRLLERQWPEEIAAVLVQQVREPEEELQIRATIPRLTDIEDKVSLLVQNQYEENPYPRWVRATPAGKAKDAVGYFCQKFPLVSSKQLGNSGRIDVLIGGCGTGQHSIESAQLFRGAQVLAVDLSMSSLAYAKRKTRELGVTSIEYAQADLLKLGALDRSFDIVESVGVLHHLADPWAGWRVLLSLLRPGGFMKLGFYSEVARRNIVKVRTHIAERGYGATANEIRRCRQDLVDLGKSADFGTTFKLSDFFSVSNCRDLLFHVQEHRMTLVSIDAFLRENNLVFLGFEIAPHILHAYKRRFPDDHAATNLSQWQIFESENPDTFLGMYQFWIQKVT